MNFELHVFRLPYKLDIFSRLFLIQMKYMLYFNDDLYKLHV